MATNRTRKVVWASIVLVALLVVAVTVFAFSLGKYDKVRASSETITLPVAKLVDGKARFYKYEDGGKEIAFIVLKTPGGSFKTAFDACDSCYREKKGYEQQGDKMNCKNCNKKFAINRLGPNTTGGCNPEFLPHQVIGGTISIKTSDLKTGAKYF